MLKKNTIITCLWLILTAGTAIGGQIPSKEELLSLYEKSVGMPNKISFTIDTNTSNVEGIISPKDEITRYTIFCDGNRKTANGFQRVTEKKSGVVLEDTNTTSILDERCVWIRNKPLFVSVFSEKDRKVAESQFLASLGAGIITEGIILGTTEDKIRVGDKRLPDYLRECPDLRVRDEQEYIDGHPTFVLEGKNNQGKFILWLDPNAGFHPRRVELHKTREDLLYGQPLSSFRFPNPEFANKQMREYNVVVDSVKIESINGVLFMTAAKMTEIRIYADGHKVVLPWSFSISNINLNPDFDVSKPFEMKVPDGTPVYNEDFPGGRFEVRQGKIVSAGTSFDEIDKTIEQFKQQQ